MGIDIGRRWIGISFVTAAVLAQAGVAAAAPAWCPAPGKLVQGNPESLRNSRGVFSVGDAVLATVYLSCMDPKQLTPADRQLGDTSRAQLTQQLNMTDADWADAAAWTQNSVRSQVVALSHPQSLSAPVALYPKDSDPEASRSSARRDHSVRALPAYAAATVRIGPGRMRARPWAA